MSLRDELQRPHVRALLIGGGIILLLAIALYFATRKKTNPLDASNPNGLNADASGAVPTVLVLPPPIIQLAPPPLPSNPDPQLNPPTVPGLGGPTGILSGLSGGGVSNGYGMPAPTSPPTLPGLTGPTGLHA